ncbi:uncharacterized protein BJ171DRAFT_505989 [Polychytrium aggregatum]|uniref:uncharacterized protein n=1 Tax=Polychytrium aggregatum TaxID=110093 RepID=UPI0022FE106D|nr:uncharacterized protein BJ171DRAFT_505989 [Polychytrium aggregatum]KAI9204512.1 hypothetical protein BJ171DRAFT_505989 [Polychytrium aggregatum]
MIQRIIALSALVGLLSLWWLNQRKSSADSPSKGDRPRDTSKKESGTSDPEALDPLDEFLHQYGLDQQKLLLLEKGYNTIDVILEMTDDEMADLGLERLVVKKIKIAQRKNAPAPALSDAGPPTAATSPPVLQLDEIRVEEPVEIPIAEDYSPVQPQHNWMCQNQYAAHEVFISYRVESDTVNATTLHGTLAVTPQGQTAIHPYLDAQCLCNGMDWEQGFINDPTCTQVDARCSCHRPSHHCPARAHVVYPQARGPDCQDGLLPSDRQVSRVPPKAQIQPSL